MKTAGLVYAENPNEFTEQVTSICKNSTQVLNLVVNLAGMKVLGAIDNLRCHQIMVVYVDSYARLQDSYIAVKPFLDELEIAVVELSDKFFR